MSDGRCILCSAPDPLRLGLCTACGPAPRRDDALVFINESADRADRERSVETLGALFGNVLSPRARRRAALGGSPLVRMPRILAERVAARLDAEGLSARALPTGAAWTRMPAHFFLMLACVVITGSLAGARVLPMMLWGTPVFAALLALAAQEGMRRPVLRAHRRSPGLSSTARTVAAAALGDLPLGEARNLLADIVFISERLLVSGCGLADLDDLVISAAATAREIDVLARTRTALEMPARDAQLVERCARMHHNGIELLRRAISALASLSSSGAADPALERGRLSELVREMEAEAAARFAAALEVSAVLRPPG